MMKLRVLIVGLLLASCAVPQPQAEQGPPRELAGRSAGAPQRCALINGLDALRVSDTDRHILLYGGGRTIWANSLGQCALRSEDVLVTEPIGAYYCRGDLVRSFDRISRTPGPACVLGDFVPYTR
jgi:hypothetical protein